MLYVVNFYLFYIEDCNEHSGGIFGHAFVVNILFFWDESFNPFV